MNRKTSRRNGVTIVEVLFATGIAVFGLVGIASLISVAGKQASQSNAAAVSQVLANRWVSEFVVRGFNVSENWRRYNDQVAVASRVVPFVNSTAIPTGTSAGGNRAANRYAICIDPLFYSDPSNVTALSDSFPNSEAYRPGLFPYYQDNYNPDSEPSSPAFFTSGATLRPRLLRVGLKDPTSSSATLPNEQVNRLFMSTDDQVVVVANVDDPATTIDERDASIPASRSTLAGTKFLSNAEYSWFATLCPRELYPGEAAKVETLYTLSVVVLKRRDRAFFKPTTVGAENSPQGERVANVLAPTGGVLQNFRGGSGGRVRLSSSSSVASNLKVGDWIMLARYQSALSSMVVRWYRVIGLEAEPTITTSTWTRDVSLDGPDWVFDATFPTQATLVKNVVTVLERVVEVEH